MSRSCYNKTYALGYYAPNRVFNEDGSFEMGVVWIPHRNTTDCRYDFMHTDPECVGCKWVKPLISQG